MTPSDPLRPLRELFKERMGLAHQWEEPRDASDWRSLVRGYTVGYYDASDLGARDAMRDGISKMLQSGWWPGPEWAWWIGADEQEETQS